MPTLGEATLAVPNTELVNPAFLNNHRDGNRHTHRSFPENQDTLSLVLLLPFGSRMIAQEAIATLISTRINTWQFGNVLFAHASM